MGAGRATASPYRRDLDGEPATLPSPRPPPAPAHRDPSASGGRPAPPICAPQQDTTRLQRQPWVANLPWHPRPPRGQPQASMGMGGQGWVVRLVVAAKLPPPLVAGLPQPRAAGLTQLPMRVPPGPPLGPMSWGQRPPSPPPRWQRPAPSSPAPPPPPTPGGTTPSPHPSPGAASPARHTPSPGPSFWWAPPTSPPGHFGPGASWPPRARPPPAWEPTMALPCQPQGVAPPAPPPPCTPSPAPPLWAALLPPPDPASPSAFAGSPGPMAKAPRNRRGSAFGMHVPGTGSPSYQCPTRPLQLAQGHPSMPYMHGIKVRALGRGIT